MPKIRRNGIFYFFYWLSVDVWTYSCQYSRSSHLVQRWAARHLVGQGEQSGRRDHWVFLPGSDGRHCAAQDALQRGPNVEPGRTIAGHLAIVCRPGQSAAVPHMNCVVRVKPRAGVVMPVRPQERKCVHFRPESGQTRRNYINKQLCCIILLLKSHYCVYDIPDWSAQWRTIFHYLWSHLC